MKNDVYEQITNELIAAMENAGKFEMPWKRMASLPHNAASKTTYNGINILALAVAADAKGYSSNEWATYKQWQDAGAQVKKGEKATTVVFYKTIQKKKEDAGEEKIENIFLAKSYKVFNADQVEGYEAPVMEDTTDKIDAADNFIKNTGAEIRDGRGRAYYSTSKDYIGMPDRSLFHGTKSSTATEAYYSTALHELVHWTGAKARCDRDMTGGFGSKNYAFEELIAEFGAAFLCAELNITQEPREDHAAYLKNWLEILRSDKRAAFRAAGAASKAVAFLKDMQYGN